MASPIQPQTTAEVDATREAESRTTSALRQALLQSPAALTRPEHVTQLAGLLQATSADAALEAWLGDYYLSQRTARKNDAVFKEELVRRLNRDVALIDELLNRQLNEVLHHPDFQRLEASWRGLAYLTELAEEGSSKVRVLNATWRDLDRDFSRALEFDQSEVFRKVYEEEFGTAGGEPYGMLIADFEVQPTPSETHPHNDLDVVRGLAQVAAAAFCPVILNADPAMFGMDHFGQLEHRVDHSRNFSLQKFVSWRSFRESEHARFVGLTLPRVLMRTPYADDGTRVDDFCFVEDVSGPDSSKYLWGGAAFAFGEVVLRSYNQSGWLADIRGFKRDQARGGVVEGLPIHHFGTDAWGNTRKCSTDVIITEELEQQLAELGFIPLCDCKDTDHAVFYSNQSVQKPKVYDREAATVNARLSSMLQYMLCVSRFAHYIKVIGREKTGSFSEAEEFERYLHDWVLDYVTADRDANDSVKAAHPLRGAQVQVFPVPGKPGAYNCTMHLSPHYELD
ncbi:MAG: type VI secretion system contractile sheath large subunit, partial [Planctomycetales bacterium]|nr:type VI secretion system contractile sheath large subunit [Planctomycetales bacterium]